jgi:hypothetical protein
MADESNIVQVIINNNGLAYMDTIETMLESDRIEFVNIIQKTVESFLMEKGLRSCLTNDEFAKTL